MRSTSEPAGLSATIAPFGDGRIDEYRVGIAVEGRFGRGGPGRGVATARCRVRYRRAVPAGRIRDALREAGVTQIQAWGDLSEPETSARTAQHRCSPTRRARSSTPRCPMTSSRRPRISLRRGRAAMAAARALSAPIRAALLGRLKAVASDAEIRAAGRVCARTRRRPCRCAPGAAPACRGPGRSTDATGPRPRHSSPRCPASVARRRGAVIADRPPKVTHMRAPDPGGSRPGRDAGPDLRSSNTDEPLRRTRRSNRSSAASRSFSDKWIEASAETAVRRRPPGRRRAVAERPRR
jgi:hypothetical protein